MVKVDRSAQDKAAQRALADLVRLMARQAAQDHCTRHSSGPSLSHPTEKD